MAKRVPVRVLLPDKLALALKEYALARGVDINDVVEEALKRFIQRPGFAHRRIKRLSRF